MKNTVSAALDEGEGKNSYDLLLKLWLLKVTTLYKLLVLYFPEDQ